MPARHYILIIFAFWVATCGWLYQRDLRPLWWRGTEPPPFTIDLADEASAKVTTWSLLRKLPDNKYQNRGYATTAVKYREKDDSFDVSGLYKYWSGDQKDKKADIVIESTDNVTREGELRHIRVKITVLVPGYGEVDAILAGEVTDQRFRPQLDVPVFPLTGKPWHHELDPVDVPRSGGVFNPMHPLNRLPGLRRGQKWSMPLVDPMEDVVPAALGAALPSFFGGNRRAAPVRYLDVQVLPEIQTLPELVLEKHLYPRRGGVPCLVVEFSHDDIQGRNWVRAPDGLVFRQEVTRHEETLVLDRD
jgi:hypothetical protein